MATFGTTEKNVVYANLALNAQAVSATSYTAATNTAAATGFNGYANGLLSSAQAAQDVTAFSISVLTNLGLTSAVIGSAAYNALQPALAAYINSVGNANRGVVAVQLAGLVAGLTADATFGAAATNLNNAAASAFAYSTNAANTTAQAIVVATAVAPVTAFTLTTGADYPVLGDGNASISATDLTLTSNDVITDNSATDNDTLTVTAAANISATPVINNIENVVFNVSNFAAVSVAANNITGGTITVNQAQIGGSATASVTAVANNSKVVIGNNLTTATVSLGADGSATTIYGGKATTINLDAATADATKVADAATVYASGTVALDNEVTANKVVEVLSLGGNGAAVTYTLADAATAGNTIKALTLVGKNDVTVKASAAAVTTQTITDSTTAGTTTLELNTAATSDLSKVTGVDLINLNAASGAATYTLQDKQAFKISTANTAAVTLDINDNSASTTLTGSVSVNLGVALHSTGLALDATASSDNITSLALTNSTADQSFALVAGSKADVTASGTKNLVLAATSTAKSIDASALTGNLTVNYDNTNDIVTVVSGAGADTFTNATTAIAAATKATISSGAGNDTFTFLTLANATIDGGADVDKVNLVGDISGLAMSNVEILGLTGAVTVANTSQLSGKSYVITGASAITFGTTAANFDTSTIDLSTLTFDTATAPTGVTVNAANGLSTAKFTSTTGATIIGSSIADTITGTANADSISGGAGADSIVGGAGVDTIVGGEGADSIVGGAGADAISLTETTAAADVVQYALATEYGDTVTGFAAGTGIDVISFAKALAGSGDTTLDAGAGAASVAAGVVTKATIDVDVKEAVLVSAAVNAATTHAVTAANLSTAASVAALIADAVTVTDGGSTKAALPVLFVVEASDATTTAESFAVWSWTQSADQTDTTVDAAELTLIGTFTGTGTVTLADIALV